MKKVFLPLKVRYYSDMYLKPTYFFDFNESSIQSIIEALDTPKLSQKEKSIALYRKIRDGWRYDPYTISLSRENYKASHIAEKSTGNCVEKSILLVACLRALAIPARLHLGKVKNHLAAERLIEKFGTNELTPHGMVNLFIDGNWLKCSPAFNADLCTRFKVKPLEFDGNSHSYLQQYNAEGTLFMEYTDDYGYFEDVPLEFMRANVKSHYPHIFDCDDQSEYRL